MRFQSFAFLPNDVGMFLLSKSVFSSDKSHRLIRYIIQDVVTGSSESQVQTPSSVLCRANNQKPASASASTSSFSDGYL
jgi:hypothetical protein